jgi:hypothetical protein
LHHALGLALTRLKRADEAIAELRRAVTPPQKQTLWRSSQGNVELMTQEEVLNFKPAP